jgi:hypothetical protein
VSTKRGTRGSADLRTRLVLLYEGKKLLHGGPGEFGARSVLPEGQQAGGGTRNAQHNAIAIPDENVTVRVACRGDQLELPAIKGVKRIRHRDVTGCTVWVVEAGINIAYRLIAFPMRS